MSSLTSHIDIIESSLLEFGFGIFQAVKDGRMPASALRPGTDLPMTAVLTMLDYVAEKELTIDQINSLIVRVIAFEDLLFRAALDARTERYFQQGARPNQVPRNFFTAASSASVVNTAGAYTYDLESICLKLQQ